MMKAMLIALFVVSATISTLSAPTQLVTVELPEEVFVDHPNQVENVLKKYRKNGADIVLTDFEKWYVVAGGALKRIGYWRPEKFLSFPTDEEIAEINSSLQPFGGSCVAVTNNSARIYWWGQGRKQVREVFP